ncbi:Ubiquitin carboxyl-terminal hydrolase 10 [Friedmanniomyces endolithicus]|nr:Ubiquitin carboxyl-terminal hydrolase 10 [Friedmanniomyces endolithicus]
MVKRPAEEALESSSKSPASKKARVQVAPDEDLPPPPPPPPPPPAEDSKRKANGHVNGASRGVTSAQHDAVADDIDPAGDDDEGASATGPRKAAPDERYSDLYLDTISRKNMDFDFEKLCSITLSNINVYACLVCGKYFSGRGTKTPAYFHALEVGHHVYINMETKKVYVLPEGYEVKSKSLDDIKVVVDPRFTPDEVKAFDRRREPSWDLLSRKYLPGFVGLNNIKANDYLNVVYNGVTGQEKLNTRMRYRLLHPLPSYLIMHIKRFQPNKFLQSQRNSTIVTFSPRALDFSPYVEPNPQLHPTGEPIAYDLVANVTYEGVKVRDDSVEGEAERKVWKVQVREGGDSQQWWEMQDLFVDKVNADLLATKESYIMVWERRKTSAKGKGRAG